jgi:putative spermidine/putrescine transport system substrate-binding protein
MAASHLGWDMYIRISNTVPANFQAFFLDNTTWVTDTQFMAIPKGLDKDRLAVTIELMKWMMTPKQQAVTYDQGYFYPGPAIKGVPLDMAPADSQTAIKPAIRQAYEQAILKLPNTTQLGPTELVEAMQMWDDLVGAKIKK